MSDPQTILIVEDEPLVREMLLIELEDAGYTVLSAEDGETAMAILKSDANIDLLFTDIKLAAGMDGWTVAREARVLRPTLKVIYATGYAPDMPGLVEGARFFKKPYLPMDIVTTIRQLLG